MLALVVVQGALLGVLAAAEPSREEEPDWSLPRICLEHLPMPGPWAFRAEPDGPGDASDDAAWAPSPTLFRVEEAPPGWAGRGWFRRRIHVDESWRGRTLGVFAAQVGAFELFVDGRRVVSSGALDAARHGDLPVTAGELVGTVRLDAEVAELTLRVRAPADAGEWSLGGRVGVLLELCEPLSGLRRIETVRGGLQLVYACFIGFTLALGILHLLLHASVPDERAGHLDYAVFTLAVGSLSSSVLLRTLPGTVEVFRLLTLIFLASVAVLAGFGVRFFASVALGPRSVLRTWALVVCVPVVLLVPWSSVQAIYAFAFVGLMVMLALVVVLARRRGPDRHLIFFGTAVMIVASGIQMAPELLGAGWNSNTAYIQGFVVFLAAMSLHLARNVGRTHRELAGRVEQVERLSAAHLAERERAQEAALERMALEAENRQQAVRLAEADRRAALLDELAEANRKLRETQAQLVQSEKMAALGQLVAGVAHEMNTPIGAIHSVHESLSKASERLQARLQEVAPAALADRKVAAALKVLGDGAGVVARGSVRVSEIVHRLRTFARLDEAELQRADVHEGLEDTLLLARHELKRGFEIVRDYGALPRIACFPGQLNQVFLNLVINARQAMGQKGTLTIRTRDVGDGVEIQVSDDGPGIAPEHLQRIFDPGFTTKGVGVGTGLGLAICYRIVEAHHGRISVESAPGQGATFRVWLPKDLEERVAAARSPARDDLRPDRG